MKKKKFRKECKNCGNIFRAMNVKKIHCSKKCQKAFWYKKNHVPSKKVKKTCPICKKKFRTEHRNKKYCSVKCQKIQTGNRSKRYEYSCKHCLETFKTANPSAFFCSRECFNLHRESSFGGVRGKCPVCKNEYQKKNSLQVVCSKKCRKAWKKSNPLIETLRCVNCKKTFQRQKKTKIYKNVFCSQECSRKYRSSESREIRKCLLCGKKFSQRIKIGQRYCSKICALGAMGRTESKPHLKILRILKNLRIWHKSEHPYFNYSLDCFLGKDIAIEVMGGYFHVDPRTYPEPININQKTAIKRDRKRNNKLKKSGLHILYIWEDDIENHLEMCEKLILKFKERNGILSNYHSMNYHLMGRSMVLNKEILIPRFEL